MQMPPMATSRACTSSMAARSPYSTSWLAQLSIATSMRQPLAATASCTIAAGSAPTASSAPVGILPSPSTRW